ncbi:MAG: hypothetical protein HRU19_16800 [Pseudobacteriovorax sp.]|nr:hypothetical protein [Pseudobacteriovorax sp.]
MLIKNTSISLLFSLLVSCLPPENGAKLLHERNNFEPVPTGSAPQTPRPWLWSSLTRDEVASLPIMLEKSLAPEGTGLEIRLQVWLSAMHQHVIRTSPILEGLPEPKIYLLQQTGREEALALTARTRFIVPTVLSSEEAIDPRLGQPRSIDLENGTFDRENQAIAYELQLQPGGRTGRPGYALVSMNRSSECFPPDHSQIFPCNDRKLSDEDIEGFANWLNTAKGASVFSVGYNENTGMKEIELKAFVRRGPNTDSSSFRATAQGMIAPTSANAIAMSYEMIEAIVDESAVIGILAHELGHYYKAHGAVLDKTRYYGYQYDQDTLAPNSRPEPAKTFNRDHGIYTTEQEADEVAIELLYAMGLDHYALRDYNLLTLAGRASEESRYPGQWSYEECLQAMTDDWNNFKNRPPVALARNRLHQSFCYRVYNLDREFALHDYQPDPNVVRPADGNWDQVREDFLSLAF